MRKLSLLVLLLLVTVMPSFAQESEPTGELILSLANEPTSLYLPRAADSSAYNASLQLYDTLVGFDETTREFIPQLAERWEISDDQTEYTFYLRDDVTFHNGEAFTADAVVETWVAGADPSNTYPQLYSRASSVEALDDYTVRITLAEPDVLFLSILRRWPIVAPDYIREVGIDAFAQSPVGTGPFRFVERIVGDRIVYEANPDYWQPGLPRLARVVFRILPDASTRMAAVQTGEIDIANRLSAEQAAMLADVPSVEVISYENDSLFYVGFKNIGSGEGTPLENEQVRQALNYAVNREGMISAIFGGGAGLVSGFILDSELGYNDAIQPYPYDPERARELLAEAGYADGFSTSMGCPTDAYLNINAVCLSIQRDLAAVGVDVTVEFKTSNSYWSEPGYASVGPMYVDGWASGSGEALDRLRGALSPDAFYNTWQDDRITDLIQQIATTIDRDARADLYSELHQYMYDNPPFIYLYSPVIFEAVNTRVEGYTPTATEVYYLASVSVSE